MLLQATMMHTCAPVPRFSSANECQRGGRSSSRTTPHIFSSVSTWYGHFVLTVAVTFFGVVGSESGVGGLDELKREMKNRTEGVATPTTGTETFCFNFLFLS